MTSLLAAKQYIQNFIIKYEIYLQPLGKLFIALITLLMINSKIGYMARLDNLAIVLIVALMCSFMPMNFIIIISAAFVVLHLYEVSLECAVVVLAIFLLMYLLYYRFSPKDTLVVLLTPLCFQFGIPYVIPLTMGLIGGPVSAVSVACGVAVQFVISYIADNAATISGIAEEDMAAKFRYVIDGIVNNKTMIVTIAAFTITVIIVYIIRRLAIDHAWIIATVSGAMINIMVLLLGDLILDATVSVPGAILGTVVSVGIVKIVEFFVFHVDYSRSESVQFEDDEYYYYVKAIPKITLAAPSKTVKKIHSSKRRLR